ncbi:hypothetical protein [Jannaschia marina]|uniref:hypothetical protein n=1 Tax=Jannaschia marina TaxID=2741674 RepID=UPI0015C6F525|nr:hypothetical protein [Jannaschia marina]
MKQDGSVVDHTPERASARSGSDEARLGRTLRIAAIAVCVIVWAGAIYLLFA